MGKRVARVNATILGARAGSQWIGGGRESQGGKGVEPAGVPDINVAGRDGLLRGCLEGIQRLLDEVLVAQAPVCLEPLWFRRRRG